MNFNKYKNWLFHYVDIKNRLKNVWIAYLLFLMVSTGKHSLEEAARFSGLKKTQFSKFLKNHSDLAVYTLDKLSKKQAKKFAKVLKYMANNKVPWKIAIIIDSTIQNRSTRHADNAQRFNHGKGFVLGHQWTNIILIINDMVVPLMPIPFHAKKYCRKNGLEYKTEHELVVEYITDLNLEEYIGPHNPKEVVVLADSGYDDKKIENAIVKRNWKFIIALGKTRSVKTEKDYLSTLKSKGWIQIAQLFKNHRWVKWLTICIPTNSTKSKRMEFRIRQIIGYLRYVGKVQLICSEFKKRPDGRRKYLACNDLKATAEQILIGYRIRWSIELFHKTVKMHLGFEDVATKWFTSVKAHVHWVYCAYILLHFTPPGISDYGKTVVEKRRKIKAIVDTKEINRVRLLLTQFGGVEKFKSDLRTALQAI
jgi:hypothetical protein